MLADRIAAPRRLGLEGLERADLGSRSGAILYYNRASRVNLSAAADLSADSTAPRADFLSHRLEERDAQ